MIEQLRQRMMVGILIGVIVLAVLVILSDAGALSSAVRDFDWRLVPALLGLTLVNYALRFVKWQYYLRVLDIEGLSRRESLLVFVAGLSMVMIPAKVGELLKSYLVRVRCGAPMVRTAPIIFAERLTDGLSLLALTGVGMFAFQYGWPFFVAGTLVSIIGLILIQQEWLVHRVLGRVQHSRLGRGRTAALADLYDSARTLLRPGPLLVAVAIGIVSWFAECVVFFLILTGLGLPASWSLLLAATFVFAASGCIGGVSMLPGGLGAAELSSAALLLLVIEDPLMTSTLAGTATLLIRVATLWFGLFIGIFALMRVSGWVSTVSSFPSAGRWQAEVVSD